MSLAALKAQGINAASITYDSRDVLQRFSQSYAIEYPMLSDEGSRVIRAFGILNSNIPEDHPMLYGVPFPGDYLIAPDGTVRDKMFLPTYEHRPSATQIALRHGNDRPGNSVEIKTDTLRATIGLSADKCFPGQQLGVTLEVHLEPGWHIYGEPLPKSYQPTALQFEDSLVGDYALEMPTADPILLKALGETLPAYRGEIRAFGKMGIRWSPPIRAKFLEALGPPVQPGLHQINGMFLFQACSDEVCQAPQSIKFQLPLTIEPGVPAPPKKSP